MEAASVPVTTNVTVPGTSASPQGWRVFFKPFRTPMEWQTLQILQEQHGALPGCVLCRELLALGEAMTHVISAPPGLFPNRFVHTHCVRWEDLEVTTCQLIASWQDAQHARYWFL
jgi:hypothetical protein